MIYFIVNEYGKTGQAKQAWKIINEEVSARGIEYKAYLTKSAGDATRYAEKISALPGDSISLVVVGGDGTFNEVINGIEDFYKVRLGFVPLGSANDFATGIGISPDPLTAIDDILDCKHETLVDLGQVTFENGDKRLFAVSAGIGLDAEVCKRLSESELKKGLNKLGQGHKSYVVMAAKALLSMKHIVTQVVYDSTESREFTRMVLLAAMNMPMEGGGVVMAPEARSDDGMLTMCCGHDKTKVQAPRSMMKLLAGKHVGLPEFEIRDFKKLDVHTGVPVALHTDGEYCGEVTDITFECLHGRLKFLKQVEDE